MKCLSDRVTALLLAGVLLLGALAGCSGGDQSEDEAQETQDQADASPTPTSALTATEVQSDGRLSISYDSSSGFNPYSSNGISSNNLAAGGLIYEGLFALAEDFTAEYVLCERLSTVDGINYTLELKSSVSFHSGGTLTAGDVLYSIEAAKASDLYGDRLDIISSYSQTVDSEGEKVDNSIDITLSKTHGNLAVLLTFPIIEQDTGDGANPPGTGPYVLGQSSGTACLEQFSGYWGEDMPIDVIYLTETPTMEQLTADFNSGLLDIVGLDVTSTGTPSFSGNKEIRNYDTTLMDYIGFNIWRGETGQQEVREAISYAIDREYIANNIMMGNAVESALPLHPSLSYYDTQLNQEYSYDLEKALKLLSGEGEQDEEEDEDQAPASTAPDTEDGQPAGDDETVGQDETGETEETENAVTLTLLVCSGSTTRMEAAVYIAQCVSNLGYRVTVEDKPYDEYIKALENGEFDLFYAQIRLQTDFDLTQLLVGELTYGGMETLVSRQVVDDFLASGTDTRAETASTMCEEILSQMPFAVIGFRHQAVVIQKGVVTNMKPTQENIYHGVAGWSVKV